jgi:hypothetical protein
MAALPEIRFVRDRTVPPEALGALWRRLELAGSASFFVSWTWIGTWLRCLPSHLHPEQFFVLKAGREIGAAILVPGLVRRRGVLNVRQLHFNATGDPAFDCITVEHNGFVGTDSSAGSIWPAFLRWFEREGNADELVIGGNIESVHDGIATDIHLLQRSMSTRGFAQDLSPGGMEAILSGFSRNTRQLLRRNVRDWTQLGELRIETAPSFETALCWFGEMKKLHIEYWISRGRRHAFHHPFFEIFHHALIETGMPNGSVRIRRISAGLHVLGYLYDFCHLGRIYAYQSGFDGVHPDLRPGYVSHLLAMEQDAREGMRVYDFLGGDNQLKRSLGRQTYALRDYRFSRRTAGLRLEAAASEVFAWLRLKRETEAQK